VLGRQPLAPIAEEKRAVELYYESRIRSELARIQPRYAPSVAVVADVDLSKTGDHSLGGWTPGVRNFPLRVTLAPAPATESEAEVRHAVAAAIDTNVSLSDTLAFSTNTVDTPTGSESFVPPPSAPPVVAAPARSGERDHLWLLAPVGLAIVGLLLLIALRSLRPSRLTPEEREEFAARLREALEQEGRTRHV
jgi:hypothetical protein